MEFKDSLQTAMLNRDMSAADLARASGVTEASISYYLKGTQNPTAKTVGKLAKALGMSVDALLQTAFADNDSELSSYRLETNELELIEAYRLLSPAGQKAADENIKTLLGLEKSMNEACATGLDELSSYRELRRSQQSFSAGHGVYLGPEAFDTIRVQDNELTRQATFCGTVAGDSMEPLYHDGDVLLVDSTVQADVDEIGIFTLDGHGYVKKRGYIDLVSLNPDYAPIPLNDSIRCNGKVIGVLSPKWIAE